VPTAKRARTREQALPSFVRSGTNFHRLIITRGKNRRRFTPVKIVGHVRSFEFSDVKLSAPKKNWWPEAQFAGPSKRNKWSAVGTN